MSEYRKLLQLINDAEDLDGLFEKLIKCITPLEHTEAEELIKEIKLKIKHFKKTDKEFINISKHAIHSERLAAMGQMAAAVSHELRNPLSGIKVASEYLKRKCQAQEDVVDIINNIHNEIVYANNIIANILEYTKISKPKLELCQIKSVVEEAILSVAQQGCFKNIEIKKQFAEDLPAILLDTMQIRQVFMNLFNNAAEAMLGGGNLNIDVCKKNDFVIIKIADSGVGIEKNNLAKLFVPFFTTKLKGIGLGLTIAQEIIENHSGEITVESKLGRGTSFTIRLPVRIEEQ